jgi:wyosine [tRNA(Phe)-imidazoG37] synthetase (radical SAM superfamily)
MLRAYARNLRNRCLDTLGNTFSLRTPPRSGVEAAFAGFFAKNGARGAMLAAFASVIRQSAIALDEWLEGRDPGSTFAEVLIRGCNHVDDGNIWHRQLKFRSYVDVSVQVMVLRRVVEWLAKDAAATMPVSARELTELVLEHQPDARAALLVHAQLLLEEGDCDAAIAAARAALNVQAVCTTAQELLFDAYRAKRAQGSTAPELAAVDYDLSDKFCHLPFTHLSTGFQGSAFTCSCPAWVPYPVGNVLEAESGDAVWNSETAQEIRRSIHDGDFSYCSKTQCSFITAQKLPRKSEITNPRYRNYIENRLTRIDDMPEMVELNHDPTCNLACPSCRTEIVAAKSEEIDQYAAATDRVILPFLRKVDGLTYITGGGEALASKHFRSILRALNREEFPGLEVYLITNGLLLTPHRWSEFPNLPKMLRIIAVSVDAARAETYEKLRRPGKWKTLMKNLEFIAAMRRANEIPHFGLNFVVQKENFREILEFVALADSLTVDQVWLQRVVNYGAYDPATFADINVTTPSHPDHAELLEILRNPILDRPSINMHMLLSLLPERVASDERLEFLY